MSIPCIICHEIFDSDNDVIVLSCGHIYHGKCLEDWKKSSPQSRTCPLCRKQFDKRSIRKVYFNVEEPEINTQMESDLKRQKLFSENLIHDNEKLQKEVLQKNMEIDKIKEAYMMASHELNKIKTDYGIKCQAFSIIDTVNNEYLQDNMKLKDENQKLKTELETIKRQSKQVQKDEKNVVDLTCSTCESDDDIQIVENSQKSEVIEILDDDSNDLFHSKLLPLKKRSCNTTDQNESTSSRCEDDNSRSAKKLCDNDDYKRLEAFILSQI